MIFNPFKKRVQTDEDRIGTLIKPLGNINLFGKTASSASIDRQRQWASFSPFTKMAKRNVYSDLDKDGVPDKWDCKPLNCKKQEQPISPGAYISSHIPSNLPPSSTYIPSNYRNLPTPIITESVQEPTETNLSEVTPSTQSNTFKISTGNTRQQLQQIERAVHVKDSKLGKVLDDIKNRTVPGFGGHKVSAIDIRRAYPGVGIAASRILLARARNRRRR